jgi:hypothetical protein
MTIVMIRVPAEYGGGGGGEEPGPDHPRLQAGQPRGQPGQGDHLVRCIPARLIPVIRCTKVFNCILFYQAKCGPSKCNTVAYFLYQKLHKPANDHPFLLWDW